MTFPKGSTTTLVMIVAIALLFGGIAKIGVGFRKKELKIWKKWPSVGIGALAVAVAITIFVIPSFGIVLVGVIFEIVLIIMSIQMISSRITGKQKIPKDKINKTQFLDLPKQARFIYHDPL